MSDSFFDRPILNSPDTYPGRHWELDTDGQPTNQIIEARWRGNGHYQKIFEIWQGADNEVPPVFIVVCNNTRKCHVNWVVTNAYEIEAEFAKLIDGLCSPALAA